MKRKHQRLALHREALRRLSNNALDAAHGADGIVIITISKDKLNCQPLPMPTSPWNGGTPNVTGVQSWSACAGLDCPSYPRCALFSDGKKFGC